MENPNHLRDPFDPYVLLPGRLTDSDQSESGSGALRAVLLNRAVLLARGIRHVVGRAELDVLPPVLRGLHRETRGVMTHRIDAMLAAYERFLSDDKHADVRERLHPVFRPIGASVRGRNAVTTPALLVLHAILYSHCEWFRDTLWEAHSADRAYSELLQSGFPEPHCRFIAAIIAQQTMLRASWSLHPDRDPPETSAYFTKQGSLVPAAERFVGDQEKIDAAAARVIGDRLRGFLQGTPAPSTEQLSAALVLHALCLHARHQADESPQDNIAIKAQAFRFYDALIETPDSNAECPRGLVFMQYGRYVHRNNVNLFQKLNEYAVEKLTLAPETNLTLCLHRVGSHNVWRGHTFDPNLSKSPNPPQDFSAGIGESLKKTLGNSISYDIPGGETLCSLLGLYPREALDKAATLPIWQALKATFAAVEQSHLAYRDAAKLPREYFPAPLVGHILHSFRDIRHADFAALHLIAQEPRALVSAGGEDIQLTIWLPRIPPAASDGLDHKSVHDRSIDEGLRARPCSARGRQPRGERGGRNHDQGPSDPHPAALDPEMVWHVDRDVEPSSLIARYVAAVMLGVWVSFAPRRLVLDYVSDDIRDCWSAAIAAAFDHNGGPLMTDYAEQIRARRTVHDDSGTADPWNLETGPEHRLRWHSAKVNTELQVVGIDIGGTTIKAAAYLVCNSQSLFDSPNASNLATVKWSDVCGIPRDERVGHLLEQVFKELNTNPSNVTALGISFAGPVADGVPVGVSGVLEKMGYTKKIVEGNPRELHSIDFARAAEQLMAGTQGRQVPAVAILNDGDADIGASAMELPTHSKHRILVLKEGTGVAFALYDGGVAIDHPCETAKAVLNLRCRPAKPSADDPKPFQAGQLSAYASKKKFATLLREAAEGLKNLNLPAEDILGKALGAMLHQALYTENGTPTKDVATVISHIAQDEGYRNDSENTGDSETTLESVAAAILVVGNNLATTFPEQCQQCHNTAGQVRRQRSWDQTSARSEDYVKGTTAAESDFPGCARPRAWDELNSEEQAAVACAWVLGRWLADSIALSWDLYGMREVRLAGGPLSDATGIYISRSARNALETIYGFDLDRADRSGPQGLDWYASARRREVKALRLVDPPETSTEAGPLGAAMAAFDRYLAILKLRQLRACRKALPDGSNRFSAAELVERAKQASGETHWIVSDEEVARMLEHESMILGLTRERDGSFRRWN